MPWPTASWMSGENASQSKVFPAPIPSRAKPGHEVLLGRVRGAEAEHEIQLLEDLGRLGDLFARQRRDEVDGRRGRGCRPAEERGEGLHLVAGLDGLHVLDVGRVEQLSPVDRNHQLRLRFDRPGDALRHLPLPARAGDQELPTLVARGPTADIGEIVGVEIDKLDVEIAPLLDFGHREHVRFGAQVQGQPAVGRVRVGRLHSPVFVRVDPRQVHELVDGRLVFRIRLVDEGAIENAVVVHQRIGVGVGLPGDGAGLLRRQCGRSGVGRFFASADSESRRDGDDGRESADTLHGNDPPSIGARSGGAERVPRARWPRK
jgi:hypothetical protein